MSTESTRVINAALYGLRRAAKPPDANHPFGHGRELYFWSFIVALAIFALGACASVYEGAQRLRSPAAIRNPAVNYVVLALALVFEGGSWWVAFRQFRAAKGEVGYWKAVKSSKDPATFTVLAEDTAAICAMARSQRGVERSNGLFTVHIGPRQVVAALSVDFTDSLTAGEE